MIAIPLAPTIGRPLRHDVLGFSDAAYDVQIQGISVAQKETTFRASVAVLNDSSTPYALQQIGLRVTFANRAVHGCHDQGPFYRIMDVIKVTRIDDAGRQEVEGAVEDSDGYAYETTGRLDMRCAEGVLEFQFPANVPLSAKQSTLIHIEFPKRFHVVSDSSDPWGWGGGGPTPTHVSVTLPVDKGSTNRSKRLDGKFSVSLRVGEATVNGNHSIPAEIHGF
ncbi:hypothetical protein ABZ896_26760 [Streptomyces sp. NPDC047072]|uniref:hypothetical protein n=1 Tax=Streptomyces sp. NPDC047072 TaxID=3154809 RepID=UPI0033C40A26